MQVQYYQWILALGASSLPPNLRCPWPERCLPACTTKMPSIVSSAVNPPDLIRAWRTRQDIPAEKARRHCESTTHRPCARRC